MNQRKKNIRLLIYLVTLVVITLMVYYSGKERSGVSFDKNKFTLDEHTVITEVILEGNDYVNRLVYNNGAWEVNGRFLLDKGMRDVFFAVLSQVEVKRPASESVTDSLLLVFRTVGIKVRILNNSEVIKSYAVVGDTDRFTTWFLAEKEQQPYLMQIPGYHSFIAGIYRVSENDWRERFIWTMEWTRLKKFTVDYTDESLQDLVFEYADNIIRVPEIDAMDTAEVMDYLQFAANLQAERFLEEDESIAYNIQLNKMPYAMVKFEEIGNRHNSLALYPLAPDNNYVFGILNNDQAILLDKQNVLFLYRHPADFRLN